LISPKFFLFVAFEHARIVWILDHLVLPTKDERKMNMRCGVWD